MFHASFGTQLMETTKLIPTIKILVPRTYGKVGSTDIEPGNQGEKNKPLVN